MKRVSILVAVMVLSLAASSFAQVEGLRIEGGAVFLTNAGSFNVGTSEIQSDAGYAFRGRLRYGFGFISVAAEVQESSQNYGMPPSAAAPQNLNATFVGGTVAIHPFKVIGIAPYGEIGLGKVFFGDQSISTSQGSTAGIYGLGVGIGMGGRVGLDVGMRFVRLGNLSAQGVVNGFDYDPLELGFTLSIKL